MTPPQARKQNRLHFRPYDKMNKIHVDSEPGLSTRTLVLSTLVGRGLGQKYKLKFESSSRNVLPLAIKSRMVLAMAPGSHSARPVGSGCVHREQLISRVCKGWRTPLPHARKNWGFYPQSTKFISIICVSRAP